VARSTEAPTRQRSRLRQPGGGEGVDVDHNQDSTSCQIVLVRGQPVSKSIIVSSSHNKQHTGCGSPCRVSRSAVQHLSRQGQATQMKNFILGGAKDFNLSLQKLDTNLQKGRCSKTWRCTGRWLSTATPTCLALPRAEHYATGSTPGRTARGQEHSKPL
jgi:hypothetical protein